MIIDNLVLQGNSNNDFYSSLVENVKGRIVELRKEKIKESLKDFQNAEHRLEFVLRVHGIDFINDSKATNVNATWYALESMNRPVIWIAGGMDKNNNYNTLKKVVENKVKTLICIGKDNSKLIKTFKQIIPFIIEAKSIQNAVNIAYEIGTMGDVVLLSPACPSFDLFQNYEDRGKQFKQAVYEL